MWRGKGQFTHLAGYHAGVIIRAMLFGLPAKARTDHIPHVTYTDPELAHVRPVRGRRAQAIRRKSVGAQGWL